MTNIRDIARLAGYSVSTVSRCINDSGYVSANAKQKIQKVIDDLDYVPNEVARDLSRGRTFNVGVVLPHTDHPYFTHVVKGIMNAAFASGFNVVLLPSKYDADLEIEYLEQLRRKSFDALIFTSRAIPLKKLAKYQKYGSIVCCGNVDDIQIACAYALKKDTFIEAFRWIKNRNFKNIGILLSRDGNNSRTSQLTLQSFQTVYQQAPKIIDTTVTTYADGYRAISRFHQKGLKPDFIFANGDDVAAGARQYYLDHQEEVPPMMGQENQLSGRILNLSTIDHQFQKVGKTALELAVSQEIKQIAIPSKLIKRS